MASSDIKKEMLNVLDDNETDIDKIGKFNEKRT